MAQVIFKVVEKTREFVAVFPARPWLGDDPERVSAYFFGRGHFVGMSRGHFDLLGEPTGLEESEMLRGLIGMGYTFGPSAEDDDRNLVPIGAWTPFTERWRLHALEREVGL